MYYVVVWSFIRQVLTIHVLRPLAVKLGIKSRSKLDRFGEQGYASLYFTIFGSLGIVSPVLCTPLVKRRNRTDQLVAVAPFV
jgi:acyl-CoA-dependent ceramide synthase